MPTRPYSAEYLTRDLTSQAGGSLKKSDPAAFTSSCPRLSKTNWSKRQTAFANSMTKSACWPSSFPFPKKQTRFTGPTSKATSEVAGLDAGIVPAGSRLDALHVALAAVSHCAIIVSWNFRHIVNYRRIPMYNGINMAAGLNAIAIYSPLEVTADED